MSVPSCGEDPMGRDSISSTWDPSYIIPRPFTSFLPMAELTIPILPRGTALLKISG